MARADHDPAQAETIIQQLRAESNAAETVKDDALDLAERLERDMDTAFAAGNESEVARLQEQHQRAEIALEAAEHEFKSLMDELGDATTFWYEEDEEDEEDED